MRIAVPEVPTTFTEFFNQATNYPPYEYQRRLATEVCADAPPSLAINVPTAAGKTSAAVLAWLWNRCGHPEPAHRTLWPRRLIYCLPMRVLVEQTAQLVADWLAHLNLADRVEVRVLMGGEEATEWDTSPERDAVLIGTQDMLLSRALNRGYGMSCYRWPMQFALLNNDALWVIDEVQLMGNGLATTTQLQAFRRRLGTFGNTATWWMSATLERAWLTTVDIDLDRDVEHLLTISPDDRQAPALHARMTAQKPIHRAESVIGDPKRLADEIVTAHRTGTRTLVVVNTVERATELHRALSKQQLKSRLVLVHSRFRPPDRKKVVEALLAPPEPEGAIIISTQVVEAGVDVSATTLFTELAPWASLVQRFGRCNRTGSDDATAAVYWIDLPPDDKGQKRLAPPYDVQELLTAQKILLTCADVGPFALPKVALPFVHRHVLRRKDILELFDTTPDLAGRDIDVSRFIRETSDQDIQVFWRDVPIEGPAENEPLPHRNELCPAPISDIVDLVKSHKLNAWMWDSLEGTWVQVRAFTRIYPGIRLMLRHSEGRYLDTEGWSMSSKRTVHILIPDEKPSVEDYSSDSTSERTWMQLSEHTDRVVAMAAQLAGALNLHDPWRAAVLGGARWHDAGKAHPVFQTSMRGNADANAPSGILAKTPLRSIRHARRGFRHELASGVLALMHGADDLTAYLAASHHGKVRLSLRSLPVETRPPEPDRRFARGVWDGELIPQGVGAVDLGGGVTMPATHIDLSFMELGDGPRGPSWLARMLALRDRPDLGPFRLALLEAVLKAADERASGSRP